MRDSGGWRDSVGTGLIRVAQFGRRGGRGTLAGVVAQVAYVL